MALVQKFVQV
jgi:hypothetical protein